MVCLLIVMSASSAVAQVTRVVDDDGQGTSANCDAATAAFMTVGAAITAAAAGDTVLVCPGTYIETVNFGGKAIAVRSTDGPSVTVLDGNAVDSVVILTAGETATSILEGFTIRNGRAQFSGGGIRIAGASPVIRRNLIVSNAGCDSLGIGVNFGSPLIEDNTIANNRQNLCVGGTLGGGISILGTSTAIIRRNLIYGNGNVGFGGGIGLNSAGSPTIEYNVISGNNATDGGGIGMLNDASPSIRGNLIVGNEAQSGGGIYWVTPSSVPGILLVNNTIVGNLSSAGSGLYSGGYEQNTRLWNNIIVAAPGQTAVLCGSAASFTPAFFANDVYSATGAAYGGICTDQTGTNGNISADPLFVDPSRGDYHVLPGSPVIDAGNNAAPGLPTADVDGHSRILDGNGDTVPTVDIGADEAASTGSAPGPFNKSSPPNAAQDQKRALLLTWEASDGATAYEYCYDKIDNNACDGTWTPAWGSTRATLFGVDGGTTYYWQVRAINGAGVTYAQGGSSAFWSFTTEVPIITRIIGLSGNLDFGTILAGKTATRTLTITNTGTDPLTVSSLSYPPGFSGFWSGTIAAAGSRTVTVTFSPFAQGTYGGTIRVNGDQTDGSDTIAVTGTAMPVSRIMSVTGDLAFGNVQAGMTATRTLTITNRGNDALNVFFINYPTGFSGSWSGVIAAGASQVVNVTFAPTISTNYSGTIAVSANQTFGANAVAVTGAGTIPAGLQVPWQNLASGSLEVWYVQGSTVTAQLPVSIGQVPDLNWRIVGAGDLNGDGTSDFVWRHEIDGWVAVWLMSGNAVVGTQLLSIDRVADVNWIIRAVGDINGDGRADLIWQHRTGGWIAAWFMNGSQVLSTGLLSINRVPDTNWEIVGAGDTTGDGTADIIWQHRTQGWLAWWSLRGTEVTGTQLLSFPQMADPTWHIRGVGDCSGDGRADLLWQQDTTGALGAWDLNGAVVGNARLLSTARPDVTWRMVGPG